jgi:hypothetical protein
MLIFTLCRIKYFIYIFAILIILSSCIVHYRYTPVDDPFYDQFIGKIVENKVPLIFYKITVVYSEYTLILYELLTAGIGSREFDQITIFEPGTRFRIVQVIQVTPNITLDYDGVSYQVEIIGDESYKGMRAYLGPYKNVYFRSKDGGKILLDPKQFNIIETKA